MRSSSHETHGQPASHADAGLETAPFRSPWICGLLRFAGICHIAGGAVALFAAPSILRVFGVASPNPELLRYIGALIAALGLGYVLAASNPAQHWPIVLGGLAANIAAPVCLFQGASAGQISWLLCWTLVANHLAWLVLFAVTLHGAYDTTWVRGISLRPRFRNLPCGCARTVGIRCSICHAASPCYWYFYGMPAALSAVKHWSI